MYSSVKFCKIKLIKLMIWCSVRSPLISYLLIMPEKCFHIVRCFAEGLPIVLGDVQLHLVALPVVDQEPPQLLGVELHVRGVEGDGVRGDGLAAVPRHEDVAVAGVREHVVAVVVRVVEELVDCGLGGLILRQ